MSVSIPDHEVRQEFSRSGGKGGQNVNKVSTKVQLFWNPAHSSVLSSIQKEIVRRKLAPHINWRGEVFVSASSERSQLQNIASAKIKLHGLVRRALLVAKKRKATKPTRASTVRRLEHKILHSRKKQNRTKQNIF